MKVKIGKLEIVDVTLEELDELIERYGGSIETAGENSTAKQGKNVQAGIADGTRDSVVLRAFVEAGANGVSAKKVGSLLGRSGKAMRGAAKQWAARIGLTHDAANDPFEECRVGTARGIRVKADLQDLLKGLSKGGGS
jgi:hypothetical protein